MIYWVTGTLSATLYDLSCCDCTGDKREATSEAHREIAKAVPFLEVAAHTSQSDQTLHKSASKVWRAFERLRRAVVKPLDSASSGPSNTTRRNDLEDLLRAISDVLVNVLATVRLDHCLRYRQTDRTYHCHVRQTTVTPNF